MASRPQRRKPENRNPQRIEPVAKEADPGSVLEGLGSCSKMLVAGNPNRSDGKFAELCDQGDRDWLEQRPPHLACRHFNVPSTATACSDRRAIARNWVLAQEKRKLEQEEREAEYWAKRPMAHPWKVEKEQPPPGVVQIGDLYLIP